jgi:hypothetical protein
MGSKTMEWTRAQRTLKLKKVRDCAPCPMICSSALKHRVLAFWSDLIERKKGEPQSLAFFIIRVTGRKKSRL